MRKTDWRFRLWAFFAIKILKIPFTVNFTPPGDDTVVAIGFAWTQEAANKMVANYQTLAPRPTRAQRRLLKRVADRAAEDNVRQRLGPRGGSNGR